MELRSEVKENWVKSFKKIYEYAGLRAFVQRVELSSEAKEIGLRASRIYMNMLSSGQLNKK